MDRSATLELPFIMPAQAQKHVTHNEALIVIDALAQITLKSRSQAAPPPDPSEGDRFAVPEAPEGAWTGEAGTIAHFADGVWRHYQPRPGYLAWIEDEDALAVCAEDGFQPYSPDFPGSVATIGVNAAADETNRLAVAAPASLFTHEGGSHRLSVNTAAEADTASIVLSNGYSARAEIGLAGNDDLSLKVSADGSDFTESLVIDRATGAVDFRANLIPEAAIVNIMSDGGRFSGSPEPAGVTVSSYQTPPWVVLSNGATLTAHSKFVRDSVTYGGSDPTEIDADIQQLMALLVQENRRRLYPEFRVALLTAGAGTGLSLAFPDATTRYTQLYTQSYMRPVRLTTSYYLKPLAGDAAIPLNSTRRVFVDGVEQSAAPVIAADGTWRHVLTMEGEDFGMHYRYSLDAVRLFMREGDSALIAFPAAVAGFARLPVDVGQIPATGLW